jgi:hypothetical protein
MGINIPAPPSGSNLFTLTNNLPGDCGLSIGTIPRGGTLGTNNLPPDVMSAIANGSLTCSPSVTATVSTTTLASAISANANEDGLVAVTSYVLAQQNDATLGAAIAKLQLDMVALRSSFNSTVPKIIND